MGWNTNSRGKLGMGRYVNSSLGPNEQVEHETHFHWIIFLFPRSLLTLWIAPLYARLSSEFVITTRRIVIKTGLMSIRTVELNLNQVESINVEQSLLGRLLAYGSVTVVGSRGTREVFRHIAGPLEFRRAYQRLL